MKETIEIFFNLSMLTFIAGSMVTMGLGLTTTQIIEPFKNVKMVLLAVVSNFIIVPLFAFAMVKLLPISEGVRIGILLLSVGGGAPFIPTIVKVAKGKLGGAIGLMLLLLIVTIIFMPLAIPIMFPGASVSMWDVSKSLIFTMLIPLLLALFVKARFSDIAARIQPFTAKLTNLAVLATIAATIYLYTKTIIANANVLPIILLFFLGAMAIGYFTGGKNRDARITLAVGTSLRNPPVAILVASQHFSSEPMAAMTPLLVIIIGLSILFPLAAIIGKKA